MQKTVLEILNDQERFEKLSDGWIKDKALGLDWGPSSEECMDLEEAKAYAEKAGGRLPEDFEMQTLIDRKKHNPAINPIFTDTKTDDWYWTSTPVSGLASFAWCVTFLYGGVNCYRQDSTFYVRPVRARQ